MGCASVGVPTINKLSPLLPLWDNSRARNRWDVISAALTGSRSFPPFARCFQVSNLLVGKVEQSGVLLVEFEYPFTSKSPPFAANVRISRSFGSTTSSVTPCSIARKPKISTAFPCSLTDTPSRSTVMRSKLISNYTQVFVPTVALPTFQFNSLEIPSKVCLA